MIESLRFWNWGPYRGEHRLEFEPTQYGIWARREDDPEHSNWSGKTFFVSTIPFALFGIWPKHPSQPGSDSWISWDESEGGVEIRTCGLEINRFRKRGTSTQLRVRYDGTEAKQDQAQELIERRICLTERDAFSTVFARQKDHATLMLSDPGPRTEMVSGWLRLDLPREGAKAASSAVRQHIAQFRLIRDRIDRAEKELAELKQLFQFEGGSDEQFLTDIRNEIELARNELTSIENELDDANALLQGAEERKSIKAAEEALKQFEQTRPSEPELDIPAAKLKAQKLREEKTRALDHYLECRSVAEGKFSGQCPVTRRQCPITQEINAGKDGAEERLNAASERKVNLTSELDQLERQIRSAERQMEEVRTFDGMVAGRRQQIELRRAELPEEINFNVESVLESKANAEEQIEAVREELSSMRSALERAERAVQAIRAEQDESERLDKQIGINRVAASVLGPNGVQRDMAEGSLSRIESIGNVLVGESGLNLKVQWAREGKGLEASCSVCGAAFPRSTKIRACQECGAERGPKTIPRLDIFGNEFSGAADDICGLAFQLSAAAWLKERRGSPFSALIVDEPHGSLDAKQRRITGQMFARVCSVLGFRQLFLISHSPASLEQLPGRIEVVRGLNGSTVRVI